MSILRNSTYNIVGSLLPIAISLFTVPLYLQYVGVERYGVLAIVWMVLGYFGFFDLGLPRATANQIAKMRNATPVERQNVVWTALVINLVVGLLGSFAVNLAAPFLLENVFKMTGALRAEALEAMPWIVVTIPLATITGVLVGALDGRERFMSVNIIHIIGTAAFQIIPLCVAIAYGANLKWIIATVALVRVGTLIMLYKAVATEFPKRMTRVDMNWVKPLLSYGGWVSVTSAVIPILEGLDRFVIGAILGAKAVAIYTVPFNLVSRLRIIPGAMSRTLFPQFSAKTTEAADSLALQAMTTLASILTPLIVAGIFIVKPFLVFWVGQEISREAAPLAPIFLLGIWINSIAHIPFVLVEGQGRPDLIAKLHLLTLPIFVGMLWLGARWGGLTGVALAWTARVWLDSNLLFLVAGVGRPIWRQVWPGALLIFVASFLAIKQQDMAALSVGLTLLATSWALLTDRTLRLTIVSILERARSNCSIYTKLK